MIKFIRDLWRDARNYQRVRGEKDSLRRLFFDRAEHFTDTTVQILARMPGAMEAIAELIDERENVEQGKISTLLEWKDVSLVGMNSENPMILMAGVVTFPPGTEVELESGEKIVCNENTAQYFPPRMVRIGLPLTIAEGAKEQVIEYLRKTEADQKAEAEEMKKQLKEVLGVKAPEQPAAKKQDTITTDADFDLSQLTEEQRRQLQLTTKMGKG